MGYQWHLKPTIEAENILVGSYSESRDGKSAFHNYVYIKKNGKYGFIDHDGNIVVEPAYDRCNALRYGMDEFRAVYNSDNSADVPVWVGSDLSEQIKEGYTWGGGGKPPIGGPYIEGNLWSVTDNTVYTVNQNWEPVHIEKATADWSYIVQTSTYSLKAYNSRLIQTNAPMKDYGGIGDSELVSSDFGLANSEKVLIPTEYPYAYASSSCIRESEGNMYCAFSKNKTEWTIFDHEGNEVISGLEPFEDNYFYQFQWEPVSVLLYGEDRGRFEQDFYCPAPFLPTEDVIAAKKNGLCGYLDMTGKEIVRFGEFEDIRPVHNNLAWVKRNGKWGVIELLTKEGKDQTVKEPEGPCSIRYDGGTVEDVVCTEEMFKQNSAAYHKDISTLAVALSMAAYDGEDPVNDGWVNPFQERKSFNQHTKTDKKGNTISNGAGKGYYIIDAYDTLGFDHKMLFGYPKCPNEYRVGTTVKILNIKYFGNNKTIPQEMNVIYSYGDTYENENAKKVYNEYLNNNELKKEYSMTLTEGEVFSGRDDEAFSIATKEFADTILVVFSFRGTSGLIDLGTDISIIPNKFALRDRNNKTLEILDIHSGFASFYERTIIGWKRYLEEYGDYIKGTGKQVKFLFTGHSLGAACANICGYAANRGTFGDFVTEDDIYTYTYATPNVVTNYSKDTLDYAHNIFNILNCDDSIAYVPIGYVKFGKCRHFDIPDKEYGFLEAHGFIYYVDGVKTSMFSESKENWILHYYKCPVDVEIYYKGELVGRVKDEIVDQKKTRIPMFVDASGAKSFALPKDQDFEVRVSAYDSGSMNVMFQEVAVNGEACGDQYEYHNISLNKDKQFSVPVKESVSDQVIYVVDENNNRISTIDRNGKESAINNRTNYRIIILIASLSFVIVAGLVVLFIRKRKKG